MTGTASGAPAGSTTLVVPVFDEAGRFDEFAQDLADFVAEQPAGSELVFVDDGSRDGTAALVERLVADNPGRAITLVRRAHQGKGGAVAAGLAAARGEVAAFCDLDLSTPVADLRRIVEFARRTDALAIGSRDLATSTLVRPESRVRETLGRAFNRFVQLTVAPGVVDTQCGAKAARLEVWRRVLPWCRQAGYAWDAELVGVCHALGIPVQELPVAWRHDDRTKVRLVRDGAAMVRALPAIAASRRRAERTAAPRAADEVFDDVNAERLAGADTDHWWFRSKAAFVATALRRTATRPTDGGVPRAAWLADLGAGAGGVTARLGWDERVVLVEGNAALLAHARARHGLAGGRGRLDALPLRSRCVAVACYLDVLEHLDDPAAALREARRVLAPDGRLVVNVPAHPWLWSAADEALGHVRRYTRRSLRAELDAAGFRPVVLTHVFSWLVAPVWMRRRATGRAGPELGLEERSWLVDRMAMVLTSIERSAVGRLSLPLGTSVLCVAVATSDDRGRA